MFRIKICGVTSVADAQRAFDAGADAIGLNFYPGSSRFVSVEKARSITTKISSAIGVFVNSTAAEINQIASEVALQGVQLHGDEPPGLLAEIDPALVLVRAYTLGSHGLAGIAESLNACRRAGRMPAAVLIDAAVEGQFGGTGQLRIGNSSTTIQDTLAKFRWHWQEGSIPRTLVRPFAKFNRMQSM